MWKVSVYSELFIKQQKLAMTASLPFLCIGSWTLLSRWWMQKNHGAKSRTQSRWAEKTKASFNHMKQFPGSRDWRRKQTSDSCMTPDIKSSNKLSLSEPIASTQPLIRPQHLHSYASLLWMCKYQWQLIFDWDYFNSFRTLRAVWMILM